MTQPRTPGDAIAVAAQRIRETRDATKAVSQEIADRRKAEAEAAAQTPDGGAA
jgi:uncharacterized protein YoaH (UPF0181 family)